MILNKRIKPMISMTCAVFTFISLIGCTVSDKEQSPEPEVIQGTSDVKKEELMMVGEVVNITNSDSGVVIEVVSKEGETKSFSVSVSTNIFNLNDELIEYSELKVTDKIEIYTDVNSQSDSNIKEALRIELK